MHTKKTTYPPSNIWSTAYEDAVSQHTTHRYRNSEFSRISPIETLNSTPKTKYEQSDNNILNTLKNSPFVRGLLIGCCVTGLILAISLLLWLTSPSSLTTHTTTTSTTTTTTTATTTSVTTTTTTSSTSTTTSSTSTTTTTTTTSTTTSSTSATSTTTTTTTTSKLVFDFHTTPTILVYFQL